ncbi:hypothetical protein VB834_17125 [Limnoraphis robusta Tam1]|uniref:Uncharacterized protein n=1 Tax=Limnoraphis robusta CCNP1315 TaxID=3110306 RepID=A0ABU5TYE6_9CYAN|nr:hypothetical protein [Limnoraphis robusta]MEA5519967.1 hypothetical protein [Limnoraphis robusta CCNP1315]MEA5540744.1 hypothetical protein [Limnoraphis robusta Tam1]MEA5544927.1 hypothetical protein [Limnoraphis robusta CCNP1324]
MARLRQRTSTQPTFDKRSLACINQVSEFTFLKKWKFAIASLALPNNVGLLPMARLRQRTSTQPTFDQRSRSLLIK